MPFAGALLQFGDLVNPSASSAGGFAQVAVDGTWIGLTIAAIFIGASVIGSMAWVIFGRGKGIVQVQQDSEPEVQNNALKQNQGFEYPIRSTQD